MQCIVAKVCWLCAAWKNRVLTRCKVILWCWWPLFQTLSRRRTFSLSCSSASLRLCFFSHCKYVVVPWMPTWAETLYQKRSQRYAREWQQNQQTSNKKRVGYTNGEIKQIINIFFIIVIIIGIQCHVPHAVQIICFHLAHFLVHSIFRLTVLFLRRASVVCNPARFCHHHRVRW